MTAMHRDDFHALAFLQRHDVHPDRRDFIGVVFVRGVEIIGAAGLDAMACGINAFMARHDATVHVAGHSWTRSALNAFFRWAFGEMGFTRLTSEVRSENAASLNMAEGIGFVREGVRRGAAPGGGDTIILGCLAAECKYGGSYGR